MKLKEKLLCVCSNSAHKETPRRSQYLDNSISPADPEAAEFIPGEDARCVPAGHRLSHFAGGDPGPGVLLSPDDDLGHLGHVLGARGQGQVSIVVSLHCQLKVAHLGWLLQVLVLIFVRSGNVDFL